MTQNHRKIWRFQILIIPSPSLTLSVCTNINGKTSSAHQTGQWELQLLQTVDIPTLSKICRIFQLLSSWGFVVKQHDMMCFTTSRQILLLNQLKESKFYFWWPKRNLVIFYPPGEHSIFPPSFTVLIQNSLFNEGSELAEKEGRKDRGVFPYV